MHCFPRVYSRSCARLEETREGEKKAGVSVLALHSHIKCKVNQETVCFPRCCISCLLRCKYFPFFFLLQPSTQNPTRDQINSILASRKVKHSTSSRLHMLFNSKNELGDKNFKPCLSQILSFRGRSGLLFIASHAECRPNQLSHASRSECCAHYHFESTGRKCGVHNHNAGVVLLRSNQPCVAT